MARKQTRRSVSLNRAVYRVIMQEAARRGSSAAAVIDDALKALGLIIPATTHQTADEIKRMRKARGYRVVKPPRRAEGAAPIMRPSLERQLLGDGVADAMGFD